MPALEPGAGWNTTLLLEAPRVLGLHQLEVDVIQEDAFWFSDHQPPACRLPLTIVRHSPARLRAQPPLLDVTLDITNKCPLQCIQCRKTYFETFAEQRDMDLELFRKIAAELFPYARSVMLSSAGEPLMTRNFIEALEITRAHGVDQVAFITSGLHLSPRKARRIVELGVARVEFSLDGASAPVYNRIRIGSNFDKVIEHIRYLRDYKRGRRSDRPLLRFN